MVTQDGEEDTEMGVHNERLERAEASFRVGIEPSSMWFEEWLERVSMVREVVMCTIWT